MLTNMLSQYIRVVVKEENTNTNTNTHSLSHTHTFTHFLFSNTL